MICISIALFATTACSTQDDEFMDSSQNAKSELSFLENLSSKNSQKSKPDQPPIWADCIVYSGIVTPAKFKPDSDPFDELYAIPGGSFKDGLPLISDSKPGDQDYNGGRWHMNVLKSDVDPAKYANACSEEDLDLNDFESTPNYFACPLRPRK